MRIKFIGNPKAGREIIKKIKKGERCLRESGAEVYTFITGKMGDAEALAKTALDEGIDRIIVAGGDGTINEVINGVADPESPESSSGLSWRRGQGSGPVPVGIIPLGVSNVLALELGLPLNIEKASEIAIAGRIKSVPLGMADGRYFFLMAGIGFDAEVVCRIDLRLKRYLGKFAYILAGIKVILNYKPSPIDIITDSGEVLKGYAAIIGKSKFYGGRFTVTPEAGIEKEALDLCLFQKGRRSDILRYVFGILAKSHLRFSDVVYRKVKGLKITSQGKVPVQIDGDCFGGLPLEISLKHDAVRLVFPKD